MSEPQPIIVLLHGHPVDRDQLLYLARNFAMYANEIRNIVDGLVLVDMDSQRRDRVRIHDRVDKMKHLAVHFEELLK